VIYIFDQIEKLGSSIIHHGKANNRIYLMQYDQSDHMNIVDELELLAKEKFYSKIILKIPSCACEDFIARGYKVEAKVLNYSQGKDDYYFLSKFLSEKRSLTDKQAEYDHIINVAKTKKQKTLPPLSDEFHITKMDKDKSKIMASIYRDVFQTYPFPIFDPIYIQNTMDTHTVYFGVYHGKELVALASSELNEKYNNAEMTDFAIKPQFRGQQLAKHLLTTMEEEMRSRSVVTLYTIARSESLPMNCTFSSLGYHFGGTLINNTQISGKLESMNVWYKQLAVSS